MNKINFYIFNELLRGFLLILFIFLSIAWLLQFTRLMSISNLLQIDTLSIFILSIYLVPNLFTVILPFIIIIGVSITFIKLFKDREIITIYTLGLNTNVIRKPLFVFSFIIILLSIIFNFYLSPNIYEKFKLNEYELRNTINFEKIIFSNFLELNKNTIIDFKKNNNQFEDIFINYKDEKENIIFAKNGSIKKEAANYLFSLNNGFKLTLLKNGNIEKLEFERYNIEFQDQEFKAYNNQDKNTANFFEDLEVEDYLNLSYKFYDSFIFIFIFCFFYFYNIKKYKFDIKNILIFILTSTTILIFNQIIKNVNASLIFYIIFTFSYLFFFLTFFYYIQFKTSE
tara:strand:- start:1891 stop:2913 length:1023 start_codon:yes stop_codon:yes gene_type:complete